MPEILREKFICLVCGATRAKFMCGRCHSVDYCSKRCQVKDLKRHKIHCAPGVFKEMDNRGRGMVATKDIKMGDLIFKVEADMTMEDINDCRYTKIKERSYDDDMRFTRLKMSGGYIIHSGEFVIVTHKRLCLFPSIFLIRHKCCSNASTNAVINNQYLREIRAIKDIQKGEEITINYLFTFATAAKRIIKYADREARKRWFERWDVNCDCNHCVFGEDEDKLKEMIFLKEKKLSASEKLLDEDEIKKLSASESYESHDVPAVFYQKKLVEKLQKTYLAPYLMPLECAQLVIDWYVGGYNEFALNVIGLWSEVLDRRNVDLFRTYLVEMQNRIIDNLNKCRTLSCLKVCKHKEYLKCLKEFKKFSIEMEINIF